MVVAKAEWRGEERAKRAITRHGAYAQWRRQSKQSFRFLDRRVSCKEMVGELEQFTETSASQLQDGQKIGDLIRLTVTWSGELWR